MPIDVTIDHPIEAAEIRQDQAERLRTKKRGTRVLEGNRGYEDFPALGQIIPPQLATPQLRELSLRAWGIVSRA